MYVFIPRVPAGTTQFCLQRLTQKVLDSKFRIPMTRAPKMFSSEVLEIRDHAGCAEHHGLICIQPDSAAIWFIKEIKKHKLKGKPINARKYYPREKNAVTNSDLERRRKNLIITRVKSIKPTFVQEGLDSFRRDYCA